MPFVITKKTPEKAVLGAKTKIFYFTFIIMHSGMNESTVLYQNRARQIFKNAIFLAPGSAQVSRPSDLQKTTNITPEQLAVMNSNLTKH